MKLKAKTLAQAFFDSFAAKTLHHATDVLQSLEAFFAAYRMQAILRDYLNHPRVALPEKILKLKSILEASKVNADAQSLLVFLLQRKMMSELPLVLSALGELRNQHFQVLSAEAVSAAALPSGHEENLKTILQKIFGVKMVELNVKVDPEILGGVVVHAQGQVLDASLKTKLKAVELALH